MWNPYHSNMANSVMASQSQSYETSNSPLNSSDNTSENNSSSSSEKSSSNNLHRAQLSANNFVATASFNEEENQSNFGPVHAMNSFASQSHHQSSSIDCSSENPSLSSSEESLIESNSSPTTHNSPPISFTQQYPVHCSGSLYGLQSFGGFQEKSLNNSQSHSNYNYFNGLDLQNSYYSCLNSNSETKALVKQEANFEFEANSNSENLNFVNVKSEENVKLSTPSLTSSPMLPLSNIVNHATSPSSSLPYSSYYNNLALNPTPPSIPLHPYSYHSYNSFHQHYPTHHHHHQQQHFNAPQFCYPSQPSLPYLHPISNRENLFNPSVSSSSLSTLSSSSNSADKKSTEQPKALNNFKSNNSVGNHLPITGNYSFNYDQASPSIVHPSPNISSSIGTKNNPNIKVKLQDMSLWKQFSQIGTEMIITKTGR